MSLPDTVRTVYQELLKRSGVVNMTVWQRRHWRGQLARERAQADGKLGFAWGDPERADDRLGNYRHVLEWLRGALHEHTRVLELGSYGGKWTQYLLTARQVVCVDLFKESFDCLRERFGDPANLQFYQTRGDELRGVTSASIDVVFSMDTLPRVPRRSIRRYVIEFQRVLVPGGRLMVHLPCEEIAFCRRKRFVRLSTRWIRETLSEAGFSDYEIDRDTLRHGVLVLARKGRLGAADASEELVSHHA